MDILIKSQLAIVFVYFQTLLATSLKLFSRSFKIVHILGAANTNLAKIPNKVFTKKQESYQELSKLLTFLAEKAMVVNSLYGSRKI